MVILGPLVTLALFSGLECRPPAPVDFKDDTGCPEVRDVLNALRDIVPYRCLVIPYLWAAIEGHDMLPVPPQPILDNGCFYKTTQFMRKFMSKCDDDHRHHSMHNYGRHQEDITLEKCIRNNAQELIEVSV